MGLGTVISSIFAVIIALALVLLMAWGAIWVIKKIQDRQLGVREDLSAVRSMQFIRSMPLGQRERIVLVEVGDRELLLGVTAGTISLLADWPVTYSQTTSANAPGFDTAGETVGKTGRKFPAINFPARPGKP